MPAMSAAKGRPPAGGHSTRPRMSARRWYDALDAMAPYLIAIIAVAIARHPFGSRFPATVAVAVAALLLAAGAGASFFWETTDAHLTWPVALALLVLLTPLLALHASLEQHALNAPVPIELLPLAFTWTGLLAVSLLIAGYLSAMSARNPGWAGISIAPVAILVGSAPAVSTDLSSSTLLTALLFVCMLAEMAAGIGWLLPERYRWFLIPAVLATGALAIARGVQMSPHDLPGRWLFLGDAALAIVVGLVALGAPLLCRWLTGARR